MNTENKILTSISGYSVAPGPGEFDKLMENIQSSEQTLSSHIALRELRDLTIPPPGYLFQLCSAAIAESNATPELTSLKDMPVSPPDYLYPKILEELYPAENRKRRFPLFSVISFAYKTVAVVLVYIALSILIRNALTTDPSRSGSIASYNKKNSPADTGSHSIQGQVVPASQKPGSKRPVKNIPGKPDNYLAVGSITMGESSWQVKDNDLLFTFISFRDSEVPPVFDGDDTRAFFIHVDQYTDIRVSEYSRKSISECYKKNKRGKLLRKARKAKRKIEQWKSLDEKYFDDRVKKNPLDPFDLADHLFTI